MVRVHQNLSKLDDYVKKKLRKNSNERESPSSKNNTKSKDRFLKLERAKSKKYDQINQSKDDDVDDNQFE